MVHTPDRNLFAEGFYSVLFSDVHSAAPDLPLDPVIFRSLLLCIIAPGGKNLLLRSSEEDLSLVQNIVALVSVDPLTARAHANATYQSRGPIGNHLLMIIDLDSIQSVWVPNTESQNQI